MSTIVMNNPTQPRDQMVIPPVPVEEPVIKNNAFFPDVDPKRIRDEMRLEQTVTPVRLRRAIKTAMAETNAELTAGGAFLPRTWMVSNYRDAFIQANLSTVIAPSWRCRGWSERSGRGGPGIGRARPAAPGPAAGRARRAPGPAAGAEGPRPPAAGRPVPGD